MTAVSELPTISVVVPNYNGAATLSRTLDSLLDQGYPGLEVLVVDGGSDDGSVDVIRRYADRLAWWVSEPDDGQANAINKGFRRCRGEVVNWLCSDDRLEPGALHAVGAAFAAHPDADLVVGACRIEYVQEPERTWIWKPVQRLIPLMPCCNPVPQPSCFYRRRLLRETPLDESFYVAMDTEMWNYFRTRGAVWRCIDPVLSVHVMSGANKSSVAGDVATRELETIYRRYVSERVPLIFWHRRVRFPLERWIKRHPGVGATCARALKSGVDRVLMPFYGRERVRVLSWKHWA